MTTLTQTWTEPRAESSRVKVAIAWTLQILSAAMFLFAGASKIGGAAPMVQAFATIGIGQWFRYLTGAIEIVSAVLLLVPSLALFGSLALAVTMVGAIITHLFIIGGNPAPAILLLAFTSTIAWIKWSRR
jgi:uncharacterized membrane protein YphA (DoxX/SURF4 family)